MSRDSAMQQELEEARRTIAQLRRELELRTSELRESQDELQKTNAEMLALTIELDDRVARRTTELATANEKLAQNNLELQQFAYIASHDLQAPLRAISGFAQFLQQDYAGKLDESADEYIEYIVEGTQRMQCLINDLLTYSRVGSRSRELEPTDLTALIADVVVAFGVEIEETRGEVIYGPLPTIVGDAAQLSQLMENLISNALKYKGCDPPRVHVTAEHNGNECKIAVRDNGIGIDAKHHERIFEIFRRLHTQEQYPGTGMGLAVCRRIVKRHGGRIWIESEVGKGSTFFFTIPERVT